MVSLLKTTILTALTLILPVTAALSQTPTPTDKLLRPGCFSATEANQDIVQESGFVATAFYGSTVDDVGQFVDLDNDDEGKIFIKMALGVYRVGDQMKWVLLEHDKPAADQSLDVCPIAAGDLRGDIKDFRSSSASMANLFSSFKIEDALADCRNIRPGLMEDRFDSKLSDVKFDKPITNLEYLRDLQELLGNETLSDELGDVVDLRSREAGDDICNVLPAILAEKEKSKRLVAQLVGRTYDKDGAPSGNDAFSFLMDSAGRWSILETWLSGATFEWAQGQRSLVNADYFARVFDHKKD